MRPTPSRRATAIGALITAAALLSVGVQAGTASATADSANAPALPAALAGQAARTADPGALPRDLSPPSGPR